MIKNICSICGCLYIPAVLGLFTIAPGFGDFMVVAWILSGMALVSPLLILPLNERINRIFNTYEEQELLKHSRNNNILSSIGKIKSFMEGCLFTTILSVIVAIIFVVIIALMLIGMDNSSLYEYE